MHVRVVLILLAVLGAGVGRAAAEPDSSSGPVAKSPKVIRKQSTGVTADLDFKAAGVGIKGQLENLGSFEKQALASALKRRKLELDLEPAGKVLGRVHVVNLNVFGKDDKFLRIFNILHIPTREYVIRREVLLRPGEAWDDTVIQETRRRIGDPTVTALAVLAPVRSADAGKVDLLVVTRDIFSLRLNSNYQIAGAGAIPLPGFGGNLLSLSISPSENNLFGLRKQAAVVFQLDLGQWRLGPQYVDPRVLGTRVRFGTRFQTIFARDGSDFEGTTSTATLSYPLWSYRREWGGSLSFSHFDAPIRQFEGLQLRNYDNPDTMEVEAEPRIFDARTFNFSNSATRSFGYSFKSNVSLGYQLRVIRPETRDDFVGDATLRSAFQRDVLPRSERSSALQAGYSFFTPKFITYRNIQSYSLAEDVRLGPSVGASAGLARKEIGSERNFVNLSASASYTLDLFSDGFARMTIGASTRIEDGDAKDNTYVVSARIVPPRVFGLMRLVGRVAYRTIVDNENNSLLTLGGSSGLRGYDVGSFSGDTRLIANLEMRTPPLRLWFMQWGAVAFFDAGDAVTADGSGPIDPLNELKPSSNVGVGLRMLMPQLQPISFSFDLAYALNEPPVIPGTPQPSRLRLVLFIDQAF